MVGIEISRLKDPCDITEMSMCVVVVLFDLTENDEVAAHRYRPEVAVFIMARAELKKSKKANNYNNYSQNRHAAEWSIRIWIIGKSYLTFYFF